MPPSKKKRRRDRRRDDLYQESWEELVGRYGHHLQGQVRWTLYPRRSQPRAGSGRGPGAGGLLPPVAGAARCCCGSSAAGASCRSSATCAAPSGGWCATSGGPLRRSSAAPASRSPSPAGWSELANRVADSRRTPEELAILAEARRTLIARCRLLAAASMVPDDRRRNLRVLQLGPSSKGGAAGRSCVPRGAASPSAPSTPWCTGLAAGWRGRRICPAAPGAV